MRSEPMILPALLLTFGSLSDRFGRKGRLLAELTERTERARAIGLWDASSRPWTPLRTILPAVSLHWSRG
jgi:hypothetical protein